MSDLKRISNNNRRHQTQWAAQFAVASELCKRGSEVSFTLGNNTPLADLMVVSPQEHQMFLIDIKGLSYKNYWQIKRQQTQTDLYYILALVQKDMDNKFFVLTQEEVNKNITAEFERLPPEKKLLGEAVNRLGIRWGDAVKFENRWEILPA